MRSNGKFGISGINAKKKPGGLDPSGFLLTESYGAKANLARSGFLVTAVTTIATTTAATSKTTAAAPAATTGARRTRTSFVDLQGAFAQFLPVEGVDRGLGFVLVVHFNETEPFGPAGFPVGNNVDRVHGPILLESIPEVVFVRTIGKVADVNLHCLLFFLPL